MTAEEKIARLKNAGLRAGSELSPKAKEFIEKLSDAEVETLAKQDLSSKQLIDDTKPNWL